MTSSTTSCPFCGEIMESPLKFCAACGRAVTQEDLRHAGLKLSQSRKTADISRTGISRRDFTVHRKMRSFMYTVSFILALLIGYYFVMKHVLHEHMPGNLDEKIEALVGGVGAGSDAGQSAASSSASTDNGGSAGSPATQSRPGAHH